MPGPGHGGPGGDALAGLEKVKIEKRLGPIGGDPFGAPSPGAAPPAGGEADPFAPPRVVARPPAPGEAPAVGAPAVGVPPGVDPFGAPDPAEEPAAQPAPDDAMAMSLPRTGTPEQPPIPPRAPALVGEPPAGMGTEEYQRIFEKNFDLTDNKPKSTFSVDVDTASYTNLRRFLLREGRLPPRQAVEGIRIEEMVNYFKYDYPLPKGEAPFSVNMEVASCPWNPQHRLLRIGLKGQEVHKDERGPTNLVFLLDVSGSMRDDNKLPLVKEAMRMLVDGLNEDDRVAIVTYASSAGLRLPSTCANEKDKILSVIDGLQAGGSTHGSQGIQMAYEQATKHFVKKGANRVILCTDGDLNVGITDDDALVEFIKDKATSGVFLTVLGFGTGNYKDSKMEKLADHGNGTYAYIDDEREAHKVLVQEMSSNLVAIAKDVKLQVDFNMAEVYAYRLIGYENRVLAQEDFDNDKKDAGEIGAGHTVTALYELVPRKLADEAQGSSTRSKYKRVPKEELNEAARSGELLTLYLRYKKPDEEQSQLLEFVCKDDGKRFNGASDDFRFAAAVASFGMLIRKSPFCGKLSYAAVEEFANGARGKDPYERRKEFVLMVRAAERFSGG